MQLRDVVLNHGMLPNDAARCYSVAKGKITSACKRNIKVEANIRLLLRNEEKYDPMTGKNETQAIEDVTYSRS